VVWDTFVDWVRAPAIAATNTAIAANKSLVEDNQRLVKANADLSELLLERGKRESGIDAKLDAVRADLARMKANNPKVKAWAETEIPPEVLQ
jgi:hypothetical protein